MPIPLTTHRENMDSNRLTKTCTAAFRAHLDQPQWRVHRRQQCRHRRLPKTPPHWRSLPSMAVCTKGHKPPFSRRGTDSVTPRLKAPFLGQKTFVGAPSRWRNPSLPMERASGIRRARALAARRGRAHKTGGGAGRPKFTVGCQ